MHQARTVTPRSFPISFVSLVAVIAFDVLLQTRYAVNVIPYHALTIRRIGCNMRFARLICGVALALIRPIVYFLGRKKVCHMSAI